MHARPTADEPWSPALADDPAGAAALDPGAGAGGAGGMPADHVAVAALTPRAEPGAYDEWRAQPAAVAGTAGPASGLAPHWHQFITGLGPAGWADLGARQARVRHRVQEDGVTYNVYADVAASAGGASREWPLALLPAIVPADDWAEIERGVVQRARLLEATMADLYGEQRLLRDALLPASLIYAHPQYLRAAHGLQPAGGQRLFIVGFDIARAPQGRFRVLMQRTQTPSGLGYLLENRLIIRPQFAEQFDALNVQRLAASFRTLLDGLLAASPAGARSRVVLLTPGPLNETYFEQAYLARYLGITLVEGSDLTVRGQRLYLKTLRGLEQVHVVLRRVDDEFLDPLELRADSALGVPGLLQALRAGEVVLANAPGAGVLESPGLAAFWPGVAERLLGEELRLPAFTSWWCGEAPVWQAQRGRLAEFVVAPTFQNAGFGPQRVADLGADERARLQAAIDADPAAYTLQAPVRPSETPVWADGQLQPRAAVLRVFAVADGRGGWRVLPGAFTRVAGPATTGGGAGPDPWLSMQRGSASVDTWVITRGAVDDSSLLPRPLTADDVRSGGHRSVTSRSAENLFWLGRYAERAENSVRLVRQALEAAPDASPRVLAWLAQLARWHGLVRADAAAAPGAPPSPRVLARALVEGLRPASGCTSVPHSLQRLRGCAMALRERLSTEHWRLIQEVGAHFEQHLGQVLAQPVAGGPVPDALGVLGRAATHLAAITGAQTDRMTRDDGWRLLSVGRHLERLDTLAHALALGLELRVDEADDGFGLILGLFDSVITYRAQFQARRELLPLLHLLVFDTDNPRSLAWVARTMRERLQKLARHDAAWVDAVAAGLPRPEAWDLAALAAPGPEARAALVAALRSLCAAARELSDEVSRHLFAHVAAAERQVWQ